MYEPLQTIACNSIGLCMIYPSHIPNATAIAMHRSERDRTVSFYKVWNIVSNTVLQLRAVVLTKATPPAITKPKNEPANCVEAPLSIGAVDVAEAAPVPLAALAAAVPVAATIVPLVLSGVVSFTVVG